MRLVTRVAEAAPRFALLGLLVVVVGVFAVLKPETYPTLENLNSVATLESLPLMLSLAVLIPAAGGEFDLSMATVFGLSQLLVVGLQIWLGIPAVVAIVAVVAIGCAVGFINGVLVFYLQINSFIATLGTSTLLTGFATWYAGGQVIFGNLPAEFLAIGQAAPFGVPLPIVYALVTSLILWFILSRTAWGRWLYATGGNRTAARLTGIPVGRMVVASYVACSGLAALSGVVIASELGSGQPTLGPGYLLPAYAAAFLGATSVTPGRFNVWGTVIAVALLAAGVTGLEQMGIASWVEYAFNGLALIIAVAASGYIVRARLRRRVRLGDAG
jgi:ribose transport system permease protein